MLIYVSLGGAPTQISRAHIKVFQLLPILKLDATSCCNFMCIGESAGTGVGGKQREKMHRDRYEEA